MFTLPAIQADVNRVRANRILTDVVFVDRNGIFHIVNARKAGKYEENLYKYNLRKG